MRTSAAPRVDSKPMALTATIHTFEIDLADIDRGVYESFTLRVAQHPSETISYMMTRVLAYCLEYEDGIAFGGDISATEEPAVVVRDLTGMLTAWIEVGSPDAARLHAASKQAPRVAVYTHKDPAKLLSAWNGKTIHNAHDLRLVSFDPGFISELASALTRRNSMTLSRTEGELFLQLGDVHAQSAVHEHRLE